MEGAPRGRDRMRARSPTPCRAPTSPSGSPPRAPSPRKWWRRWRKSPIIFAHRQSRSGDHRGGSGRGARATPSWRRAAPTIPNQVNNVLGFPYIFRGALDVRATTINEEMKLAAADALASAGARGRAGRGGGRLSGQPSALRAELHHPRAVRSAADLRGALGGGGGGDEVRRGAASRSRTSRPTACSSRRGAIRSPARCADHGAGARAIPSASSSPRARRSR